MIKATPRVPARWGQEIFVGADKEALSEEDEFAWLPPNAIRRRSRCRQLCITDLFTCTAETLQERVPSLLGCRM